MERPQDVLRGPGGVRSTGDGAADDEDVRPRGKSGFRRCHALLVLHGGIRRVKCLDRGHAYDGPLPPYADDQDPPPCPVCGSPLRPDVVWFGEMLPRQATERAWSLAERCDAMLLIGTSGTVWPAAELPLVARRHGALVIEVNPEPSELTHAADVFLQGPSGEVLPALVEAVAQARGAGEST